MIFVCYVAVLAPRIALRSIRATCYRYGQNGELLAELDPSGNVIKEYIHLDGQPLAVLQAGQIHYIHNDHLGTPQALSDAQGTKVWSASYDPYGQATVNEDPDGNGQRVTMNLRFPGQYHDQETGLHYNWHRYYDPNTGRYIQFDPLGVVPGISRLLPTFPKEVRSKYQDLSVNELVMRGLNHPYAYVDNNPLRWTDPFGLDRYKICEDYSPIPEAICRGCVGAACGLPSVDKFCCKIDFDACIGDSGGDTEKMEICVIQLEGCNLKKPKSLPRGPKDGDI